MKKILILFILSLFFNNSFAQKWTEMMRDPNANYYDIVKENAFLATKFHIEMKDCSGKLIYKSETGYTKEKDTELAYSDALNKAFVSVNKLHYKFEKLVVTFAELKITIEKLKSIYTKCIITFVESELNENNLKTFNFYY